MKKLFIVAFVTIALVLVVPSEAQAGYSDRGMTFGVLKSSDFDTIKKDFKSEGLLFLADMQNIHFTGKLESSPVMFGMDIDFLFNGEDFCDVGKLNFTFDWWLFNPTLFSSDVLSLGFYTGPGLELGFNLKGTDSDTWCDPLVIDFAARLPIGLSLVFLDRIEIFTEFVFRLSITDLSIGYKDDDNQEFFHFTMHVGLENLLKEIEKNTEQKLNIGVRYWF